MSPARPLAVMLVALLPSVLLAWFLADPARNQPIAIGLEHFVITSNVSIVAALVAFLVARAALDVGHFRTLLIALGFGCMAGIFAVHASRRPTCSSGASAPSPRAWWWRSPASWRSRSPRCSSRPATRRSPHGSSGGSLRAC